jgi:hypothetical protein
MTTQTQSNQRSRVPNGAAKQRVVVALNADVLDKIKHEAELNLRTVSAMASLIIATHYGKNISPSAAPSPSPTRRATDFTGGDASASTAAFSSTAA